MESGTNAWETAYGMRVEVLAAFAYLLGPISGELETIFLAPCTKTPPPALALLIFETHNDYVRFHGAHLQSHMCHILKLFVARPLSLAYQCSLLSTPLILIRILASLLGFAPFLQTTFTLLVVIPLLFMA